MEGEPNEEGFIVDFRAVKRIFKRVAGNFLRKGISFRFFEYPTAENLAAWLWDRLIPFFPACDRSSGKTALGGLYSPRS